MTTRTGVVIYSLRLPADLHEMVKQAAGDHSMNVWITEACREKLARQQDGERNAQ